MISSIIGLIRKMLGITPTTDERQPSTAKKAGGATMKLQPLKTARLQMEDSQERPAGSPKETRKDAKTPAFSYEWYGSTNVGSVRDHNEDSYTCEMMDGAGLFVVADGMGGHDAGEVASSIAAEAVRSADRFHRAFGM